MISFQKSLVIYHQGKALAVSERKVVRSVYGPIGDNTELRTRYNCELCTLYEGMNNITFIKVGRLKWARCVRMDEQRPAKRIFKAKPECRRKMGKPKLRWAG
jgi:hypothetical protein